MSVPSKKTITAKQAREITDNNKNSKDISFILQKIEETALQGGSEIKHKTSINQDKQLKKLGYKLTNDFNHEEVITIIFW